MREEDGVKERSGSQEKTIEIDIIRLVSAILIIIMLVLTVVSVISFVRSFMKVSVIEVLGDHPYDERDIITASGIKYGDKLYGIDTEQIKKNIKTYCPYIEDIEVDSRFPNKVQISVSQYSASWYIEIFGDYYALNADLRVLEETTDNQKFINGGIPKLSLPNVRSAVVGTTLVYGDNDTEVRFAEEFMNMIKSTTFKSQISLVDIENRFDIYIQVGGAINVYMGNTSGTKAKLDAVETALKDPKLEGCISAEIDVSNPSTVYVRPVYDYSSGTAAQEGQGNLE